jgi:hypothetical protein
MTEIFYPPQAIRCAEPPPLIYHGDDSDLEDQPTVFFHCEWDISGINMTEAFYRAGVFNGYISS